MDVVADIGTNIKEPVPRLQSTLTWQDCSAAEARHPFGTDRCVGRCRGTVQQQQVFALHQPMLGSGSV